VVILAAVPLAIFGIVQNAIVSDIAEADAIETGDAKAGIFFGARTFMSKLGQTVAGLVVPSLLILGADLRSTGTVIVADVASGGAVTGTLGVRLTAVVAAVFCAIGLALFLLYDEKRVMAILAKKENI
jgi:Na+/melibiose symporter-like transporter